MAHAFAVTGENSARTPEQDEIIGKLARGIVSRQMAVPAIFFLQTFKPMSYIGTQALAFLDPFASALFKGSKLDEYRRTFEDRRNVEELIRRIEDLEAQRDIQRKQPGNGEGVKDGQETGRHRSDSGDGLREHDDQSDPDRETGQ